MSESDHEDSARSEGTSQTLASKNVPDIPGDGTSKTHTEREYYAPPAGLQLDQYIAAGNKQGVHHTVRYVWAIEVIKQMPSISRILDYGCGEGYGADAIAQTFPAIEIVAMDYDPEAIAMARKKYRRPNLSFITGDTRQYYATLGESRFDLAVSFDVVEHIEHRELYFANLTRYITTEGALFMSTPCSGRRAVHASPGWRHHKIEYNAAALYDVLRRYFAQVLRIEDVDAEFPGKEVFDRLKKGRVHYPKLLNPVICREPIKIKDPYADYLQGVEPGVIFD